MARTVQRQLAPDVGDAHETLHTVAEAAVVVNSVLEDLGNFPLPSLPGLDLGRLADMNGRLAQVAPAAWELSRLLGEPSPESGADAADVQLSRIEQGLSTVQASIADYHNQVTQVRQRTESLKSAALRWLTPATVLVSFVCFWIAVSQASLWTHARSWWKGAGLSRAQVG